MKRLNANLTIISIIVIFSITGCGLNKKNQASSPVSNEQAQSKSSESTGPSSSSIDFTKTDLIPQNYLEEPGVIMGTWFSAKKSEELKVSLDDQITRDKECRKWPEDCLSISFPESKIEPISFKAVRGDFLVYGFDTDGDDVKEIAIESIEKRDSDVKTLRVIKLIKGEFIEVLRVPLNGTFSYASDSGNETVAWERKYGLKSSFTGKRLDIVVYLNKPEDKITGIIQLSDLFIYQCKKITAVYDDKNATYAIKSADPVPIGK
ncbi:hypothetical protein [Desulforegula conservatrix]|uniref:hypothetical protein n=1 Tax=Desulforegula conservatrix TaxID=153026 RepID=UPI000487E445|nr:hypothetical protein [Desulforegula conservatrix]